MNSSISNSKKIPKAFLAAFLLFLVTVIAGVFYLIKTDTLPAPIFTGRVSMDEKIRFLRMHYPINADVVTIGSSSALNNISSQVFFDDPAVGKRYLNFSSWGLTMESTLRHWKIFDQIHDSKILIIGISFFDFNKSDDDPINGTDIRRYIQGRPTLLYYLKYHASGFSRRIWSTAKRRRTNDFLGSLKYDEGGGVLLDVPEENVRKHYWQDELTETRFQPGSYEALDQLLADLREKGKIGVIVQSPVKGSSSVKEKRFFFLKHHWDKVDAIAKKHGMYFYNMYNIFESDDQLFPDDMHVNHEGANMFTLQLFQRMKEDKIFQRVNMLAQKRGF
ncbi:MAG: hypothetical protein KAS66_04800 [Candidatus Omnitrophica bacterium]|nr:hypothetical protein [Candidatus Omnitrophota bacterium]